MPDKDLDNQPLAATPPRARTLLPRLALVLVAVTIFVVLFKPATSVEGKLQAVLDDAARAMTAHNWQAFQTVNDTQAGGWWDYQASRFQSWRDLDLAAETADERPEDPHVEIVEAHRETDTAWALVVPRGQPDSPRQIEFFDRVAGRWLRTAPEPDYWGQEVSLQTIYFIWRYREADDEWVRPLAPAIDAAWGQIAADLGGSLPSALVPIEVCYSFDCALGSAGDTARPFVVTPLLVGRSVPETKAQLVSRLILNMGSQRVGGGGVDRGVGSPVLLASIYAWELAQITGQPPEGMDRLLGEAIAAGTLMPLYDLSLASDRGPNSLALAQGYTLVDYVVAEYGRGALMGLLSSSAARSSVPSILQDSLGSRVDLAALERDWLSTVRSRYAP